ncbi:MAG: hypothetical protein R3200_11595 [Xanthomonadales bacterium]|nr:hypothetical protein [Xanthomonadales bacterium]
MEVKLTGWQAVAAIVVVVLFGGYRLLYAGSTLETEGKAAIEEWIANEYQRYHLKRTDLSQEEQASLLIDAADVKIESLSARGGPSDTVVRVEIAPNRAHPPDMSYTQYYRMEFSNLQGWHSVRDSTALSYYLTLF